MTGLIEKLRRKFRREKGSLIVESTLVYPVIFFVIMFLLYMGNMYYLKAKIESVVSQEAIRYAAMYADPNLEKYEQEEIPTSATEPGLTDNLYRYINVFDIGGFGKADETTINNLKAELIDTGFFSKMEPVSVNVTKHEVNNYIIYQTYEVEVAYDLKMPIGVLFGGELTTLHMTARAEAPVTDTSEFIRTVDMAVDYAERSKSGEKFVATINEVYGRVDEFVNGKIYDPSEAVAGGRKNAPAYHLTTAPDRSTFTCGYEACTNEVPLDTRLKCSPKVDCDYGVYEAYGGVEPSRGNGLFVPNDQSIFEGVIFPGGGVKNAEGKYGVVYKNGIPDFSPYAIAEVQIDNMNEKRKGKNGNFRQTDLELVKQWGLEDFAEESGYEKEKAYDIADKWREDHKYTWHELNDTKTVQLVPTALNGTCGHLGGTSESKYQ